MFRHTCHYTFVANTNKRLHLPITNIVIRSLFSWHNIQYHEVFPVSIDKRKIKIRYWVKVRLDDFTNLLCIALCVCKSN